MPQNQSLFLLHFLFQLDENHNFNLTSKITKMCEQIFKKTAPKQNSNKTNVKMPHENKNHYQEIENWFKLRNRPRMNYEWIVKIF